MSLSSVRPPSSSQAKNSRTATPYEARVLGLRMCAVKKSMKRSRACSPAAAMIAGTARSGAGSMTVMLPVGGIVDQAAVMQSVLAAEMLDQIPAADFLAAIGRVGNSVADEEHALHGGVASRFRIQACAETTKFFHPSPRTRCGPIALASGRGRRLHAAMNRRYFGLSGFSSGICAPAASRKR